MDTNRLQVYLEILACLFGVPCVQSMQTAVQQDNILPFTVEDLLVLHCNSRFSQMSVCQKD